MANHLGNTICIIALAATVLAVGCKHEKKVNFTLLPMPKGIFWSAPDTAAIPHDAQGDLIRYGRQLVANTALYLGPKGSIARVSNGMNCQNCHLDAGTKFFGNNFSAVATSYPKYKDRSASIETVIKKVNDCFERSLNGKKIDTASREMQAFVAYLKWVGSNVNKGAKPMGSGIVELDCLARAADTALGRQVYAAQCAKCHGNNGQGLMGTDGVSYVYPPLWGSHSYNIGASIFRISKLAGFAKNNMPFGATSAKPILANTEAWDVAAFINAQAHPYKDLSKDWPKLNAKPYDHPFGPYTDSFSQVQHKFGPFAHIKAAHKAK